jgi:hypothetical protein
MAQDLASKAAPGDGQAYTCHATSRLLVEVRGEMAVGLSFLGPRQACCGSNTQNDMDILGVCWHHPTVNVIKLCLVQGGPRS